MVDRNILFLDLKRENNLYEPELSAEIQKVVSGGWYIDGEANKRFENNWAKYCGTKYAIGVSNGLDALELLLRAYNITQNDSVIVPSNTYIATWLAISALGARIIPVEPDPATFNITADSIRQVIEGDTKAVIGVHLYGQSMLHENIMELCHEKGLIFIEDAAQAHGASCGNVQVGNQGHAAGFSFYPGKNLGALGDGGAITTNDLEIAEKVRLLRNYGSTTKYYNEIKGRNCRLDTMQAAVLDLKLKYLDTANLRRQKIAYQYHLALKDVNAIKLPYLPANIEEHVWHLYVIQTEKRDALRDYLQNNGVQTLSHYPIPPYSQNAYLELGIDPKKYPISTKIHEQCLSLPISGSHTDEEIDYVCKVIIDFFSQRA